MELKHRKIQLLAQGHTTGKEWNSSQIVENINEGKMGMLYLVALRLQHTSESLDGLLKPRLLSVPTAFLVQEVWGGA